MILWGVAQAESERELPGSGDEAGPAGAERHVDRPHPLVGPSEGVTHSTSTPFGLPHPSASSLFFYSGRYKNLVSLLVSVLSLGVCLSGTFEKFGFPFVLVGSGAKRHVDRPHPVSGPPEGATHSTSTPFGAPHSFPYFCVLFLNQDCSPCDCRPHPFPSLDLHRGLPTPHPPPSVCQIPSLIRRVCV